MKICIDLTSLADNFSGIERFAASITYYMIEQSDNDYILIFKERVHPMFEETVQKSNVDSVVLPGCGKLLFNQIRLPWAIHRIRADWYLFMAFPVPVLSNKKNMVSAIHDICCWDWPDTMNGMSKWYFRISHRVAIRKCRSIITISNFSRDRIVEKLKYQLEKIWIIYCGVDEKFIPIKDQNKINEVREKYSLPEEYVLSLSTLEPRKNIRLLIDAYRELVLSQKVKVPLVLAGRKGWKMEELMAGIEPEVEKNIIFTGFVDDEDLAAVYTGAKLFIFPSLYEGFGMPPLEAMACGAPVISSNAASLPEILGDAAFYFKSNNLCDLEEKIVTVLSLESNEKNLVKEKGITQSQKYNWSVEAMKLRESLKVVVCFFN